MAGEFLNLTEENLGEEHLCCAISDKKHPEKKFFSKYGFQVVDSINNEYELMALSFDGSAPRFLKNAKKQAIEDKELTIYYGMQCPFIPNCIKEIKEYCLKENTQVNLIKVDTLEKAKSVPCIFNNWAVFNNGKFQSVQLLNEGSLKKLLEVNER